jgi:hypothetical protein
VAVSLLDGITNVVPESFLGFSLFERLFTLLNKTHLSNKKEVNTKTVRNETYEQQNFHGPMGINV